MKIKKEYLKSFIFACLSIIILLLFLLTISLEFDSSRYIDSSLAIKQIFNIKLAKLIENKEDILIWLNDITIKIGGKTYKQINTLCKYDIPNQQIIKINNIEYIIENPNIPTYPCQYNISIIEEEERMISLSGNNQLLAFVLYFSNADNYVNGEEHGKTDSLTIERIYERPSAIHNPYYIEVLKTSWGWCLLKDGVYKSLGSTLQWKSRKINNYIAFEYMSHAYINNTILYPCYSYIYNNITQEYSLISGVPNYKLEEIIEADNNELNTRPTIWIVSALDYYIRCKDILASSQPIMAYLTKLSNLQSYYDLDYLSLCNDIIDQPLDNLINHYIYDSKFHKNKLNKFESGSFLTCSNELNWVKSSHQILTREKLMDSINEFTRSLTIYSLSRNLANEDYFYTLTTITFRLDDNGRIHAQTELSYSPIVQFTYGLSNYPTEIQFVRTYIIELLSGLVFVLYSFHLVYTIVMNTKTGYIITHSITPITNNNNNNNTRNNNNGNEKQTKQQQQQEVLIKNSIQVNHHYNNINNNSNNQRIRSNDENDSTMNGVKIIQKNHHGQIIEEFKVVDILDDNDNEINEDEEEEGGNESRDPSVTSSIPSPRVSPKHYNAMNFLNNSNSNINDQNQNQVDFYHNTNTNNNNNNHNNNDNTIDTIFKDDQDIESNNHYNFVNIPTTKSIRFISKNSIIYQFFSSYNIFIILDIMTVILLLFCLYYRVLYVEKARHFHKFMISLDIELGDFDSSLETIVDLFVHISEVETIYLNIIALAVGVLLLQFFRYISFDKRFVIISMTIYQSASLLLPVLLVFSIVWSAYAILGQAMYGKILNEFSTVFQSLNSLFFFVLGDTSIYNEMRNISPNGTPIFFWTYIIVVYFILFNMVLAIIMFVYEEKAQEVQNNSQRFKLH